MGKRKTIPVERLIDIVNNMLAADADLVSDKTTNRRIGAMTVLETVLHETGNYRGFRYLTNLEGYRVPGVRYRQDGSILPYDDRFELTDDSRRQY